MAIILQPTEGFGAELGLVKGNFEGGKFVKTSNESNCLLQSTRIRFFFNLNK